MPALPPLSPAFAEYVAIVLVRRVPIDAPPVRLRWYDSALPLPWTSGLGDVFPDLLNWVEGGIDRQPTRVTMHSEGLGATVTLTYPSPDRIETHIAWRYVRDATPSPLPVTLDRRVWAAEWVRLTTALLAVVDGCTTDPRLERLRRVHDRLVQDQP